MKNNKQPDIVIFLSDQHSALVSGPGDVLGHEEIDTPTLSEMAESGVHFSQAYTPSPLCVPARLSMLTGKLPSKTGTFSNLTTIPDDQATFIHSMVAKGYEAVLCGRMHFLGHNQRHGFTKRIMGDFLPSMWAWDRDDWVDNEIGDFADSLTIPGALDVAKGGDSPILEYDRKVIQQAVDYLEESHDKPQILVIGTYGPHCSYVCPEELFDKYRSRVNLPKHGYADSDLDESLALHFANERDAETVKDIRAAYCGMVEQIDTQVGQVRDAFKTYSNRSDRDSIFVYTSDHGDQLGERGIFGKHTFYEGSVKIPMFVEASWVDGGSEVTAPVNLMDIGATLCELVEARSPADQDSNSFLDLLNGAQCDSERATFSELVDNDDDGSSVIARMVRKGDFKLICYHGRAEQDLLFNVTLDPYELQNLVSVHADVYQDLRAMLYLNWKPQMAIDLHESKMADHQLLCEWGKAMNHKCKDDEDYVMVDESVKYL